MCTRKSGLPLALSSWSHGLGALSCQHGNFLSLCPWRTLLLTPFQTSGAQVWAGREGWESRWEEGQQPSKGASVTGSSAQVRGRLHPWACQCTCLSLVGEEEGGTVQAGDTCIRNAKQ